MSSEEQFETLVEKIKTIVNNMESDQLNLDASLNAFEKGMGLIQKAEEILDNARGRVALFEEKKERDE